MADQPPQLTPPPGPDRRPTVGFCYRHNHLSHAVWLVHDLNGVVTKRICTEHLKDDMRRATWPDAIRFPTED